MTPEESKVLYTVAAKLDNIENQLKILDKYDIRISKIETWQSRCIGAITICAAIMTYIVAIMF